MRSLSVIAMLLAFVPCIPTIHVQRGWVAGNEARAMRLSLTGMFAFSASARSSFSAPDIPIPPPA